MEEKIRQTEAAPTTPAAPAAPVTPVTPTIPATPATPAAKATPASQTPLVSVCMTTYNHERYLARAIESVLEQRTTFGVELVLGEDCSTDSTREICKAYAARYPELSLIHI